jgi:hypothetical protein
MTAPALVDDRGNPVPLAAMLGSPGGEGTVYQLARDHTAAAKVYHSANQTPEQVNKLRAVISLANPTLLSIAAWPRALLFDARTRQPVGFLMPRIVGYKPIQHLYNPVQRLTDFPTADWEFQIRAALSLATAFDRLHVAKCVMGDVNERNELISDTAEVRLIDCDSFQVRANGMPLPCEGGVVFYTPPELQGKSFRGLVRTENHDRFGLSVLIYQLLFVGRHPYMGLHADDASFDQLIAGYRFAQGPSAHTWGMQPPPATPTFDDIPPAIGALFRRAFERGSQNGTRPRAAEWQTELAQLQAEVVTCQADSGHKYWRGAKGGCVWCRLGRNGGPEYYFGAGGGQSFAIDEAKIKDILDRLARFSPGTQAFKRDYIPTPSPTHLPADLVELWRARKTAREDAERVAGDQSQAEAKQIDRIERAERIKLQQLEVDYRKTAAHLEAQIALVRRADEADANRIKREFETASATLNAEHPLHGHRPNPVHARPHLAVGGGRCSTYGCCCSQRSWCWPGGAGCSPDRDRATTVGDRGPLPAGVLVHRVLIAAEYGVDAERERRAVDVPNVRRPQRPPLVSLADVLWGWCYGFGVLFFLVSLFMSAALASAPAMFAVTWAVILTAFGFHLWRVARSS